VGVPALTFEGNAPPAPPHLPLGQEIDVPGDSSLYLLPGEVGDTRLIVYLHGMCGDIAAADYFREAVRAHGSLLALRGDTLCAGDRFKWRDPPGKMLERIRTGLKRVNEVNGSALTLTGALLFGYSQGADRAEKLAAQFPQVFPRIVLGGPPLPPSPEKLARARRVAILGGELETTERMREGFDALQAARIPSRFFTLECAYHGYYGTRAEAQLLEVLDWVSAK
jgi:pimeloyl-ACP methyl ester carboxylesterase